VPAHGASRLSCRGTPRTTTCRCHSIPTSMAPLTRALTIAGRPPRVAPFPRRGERTRFDLDFRPNGRGQGLVLISSCPKNTPGKPSLLQGLRSSCSRSRARRNRRLAAEINRSPNTMRRALGRLHAKRGGDAANREDSPGSTQRLQVPSRGKGPSRGTLKGRARERRPLANLGTQTAAGAR
jgi:hypothetical protein